LRSYDPYRYLQNLPPIKHHTSCYNLRNNQQIRTTCRVRLYEAAFVTHLRTLILVITLRHVAIPIRVVLGKLFTSYNIAKCLYRIRLLANNLLINCTILPKYVILIRYVSFLTTYLAKRTIVFEKSKSSYNIVNLSLYRMAILNYLSSYYLYVVISGDSLPVVFRCLLPLYLPYSLAKIT